MAPVETDSHVTSSAPQVSVNFWYGELPLEGADDFRHDLEAAYSRVIVRSEPGGLGGGLYTLFVEITSGITLATFVRFLLDGVAFDLIKLSGEKLILRPLLAAQRRLRERNKSQPELGEFAVLRLVFSDSVITLDADSRVYQNISSSLPAVLRLVSERYAELSIPASESPAEIYIPVIEDTGPDRRSRFRAVLDVDEDMSISERVFYEYWGVVFRSGERIVYDVNGRSLIREHFLYRQEYWDRMSTLWKERGLV